MEGSKSTKGEKTKIKTQSSRTYTVIQKKTHHTTRETKRRGKGRKKMKMKLFYIEKQDMNVVKWKREGKIKIKHPCI
jgi:hypothetical protein